MILARDRLNMIMKVIAEYEVEHHDVERVLREIKEIITLQVMELRTKCTWAYGIPLDEYMNIIESSRKKTAMYKIMKKDTYTNTGLFNLQVNPFLAATLKMTMTIDLIIWHVENVDTGGLLDTFDDGRRNKRLKNLCKIVLSQVILFG